MKFMEQINTIINYSDTNKTYIELILKAKLTFIFFKTKVYKSKYVTPYVNTSNEKAENNRSLN